MDEKLFSQHNRYSALFVRSFGNSFFLFCCYFGLYIFELGSLGVCIELMNAKMSDGQADETKVAFEFILV